MTKAGSGPKTNLPATTISVTSLDHPIIKSFGQAALVRWKKDYDAYRKVLVAKCKSKGQRIADHIVSWKDCCDVDLLKTACEYDWDVDPATITEKELRERLTAIMEKTSSTIIESGEALSKCFRTLQMPKMTDDAASVRRDYMCQIGKIIDERALAEVMTVKATRRIVIKAITEKLEPAWVRNAVSSHLEVNPADSLKAFANVLLSKIEAYQDYKTGQEIDEIGTGKRKLPEAQSGEGGGLPTKQSKPNPETANDAIKPSSPGKSDAEDLTKKAVPPDGANEK